MTIHEAGQRYSIPISILREYEGWGTVRYGENRHGRLAV